MVHCPRLAAAATARSRRLDEEAVLLMQVLDGRMLSVATWYDNEMGYATRLAETAAYLMNAR